ncbi:MAG: RimK family alpha-L-glutamate ligase [Thermoproteota archaeon]
MTIAVLTHKPSSYSSIRLIEEAGNLGVPCELVSFRDTALYIKKGGIGLKLFKGVGVKAVFSRPKTLLSPLMLYALSLTKSLEEEGIYVLNPFEGFLNTLDKVVTYRNLCLKNLPVPDSIASASWRRLAEMPPPFFLKPVYGSRGRGVKLVENVEEKPIVEGYGAWIVQSSAKEDNWDLRILVLGDQVLAAIKRVSDKPVTNISRGAAGEVFEADKEVETLAVKASRVLNCQFAGVDISFQKGEAFILDVNPQPDFIGVEKTMGINVAREVIKYMVSATGD